MQLRFRLIAVLALLAASRLAGAETPAAFQLTSLYHVGFWVRDIGLSRIFYHDLLGYAEPYGLNRADGKLEMAVMKVNERQVIYLFPNPSKILPNGDNLDHLGLETDNLAAVRQHLLANGVKVGEIRHARVGDITLGVHDPDGHYFEITQLQPQGQLRQHQGQSLAPERISDRLLSATIMVADLPAALKFYRDILGFQQIEADNRQLNAAGVVRLRVPHGSDYLDLIPYFRNPGTPALRGVPDFCLEVADVRKTHSTLTTRAKQLGIPGPTAIGESVEGLLSTTLTDPDGTVVVLKQTKRR
jgi:catechol 2,3-dioxygenase-like lactoylglutathione lyase family enzyme